MSDGAVTVRVRRDFPQVIDYVVGQARMAGRIGSPLTKVRINGTDHVATVSVPRTTGSSASWKLTFRDLPGVELTAHVEIANGVMTWSIPHIVDTANHRVNTVSVPRPRPCLGHLGRSKSPVEQRKYRRRSQQVRRSLPTPCHH